MMYDELIKKLREQGNWLGYTEWTRNTFLQAADAIEELAIIPAADVVPVMRGWWIELGKYRDGYNWRCSVCKRESLMARNYCPFCGARMDGDEE